MNKTVRQTIIKRANFDMNDLDIRKDAKYNHTPALFIHSKNDELISFSHSEQLRKVYAG